MHEKSERGTAPPPKQASASQSFEVNGSAPPFSNVGRWDYYRGDASYWSAFKPRRRRRYFRSKHHPPPAPDADGGGDTYAVTVFVFVLAAVIFAFLLTT